MYMFAVRFIFSFAHRFVVKNLGLGDAPYTQNVVESVNDLIKDWVNFTAQYMDKLILALYELLGSFDEEEELAWFGLSEKWEVRNDYQDVRPGSFNDMSPDERQREIAKMRKIRPDVTAYNKCKSFKFTSPETSEQVRYLSSVLTSLLFSCIVQHLSYCFVFYSKYSTGWPSRAIHQFVRNSKAHTPASKQMVQPRRTCGNESQGRRYSSRKKAKRRISRWSLFR